MSKFAEEVVKRRLRDYYNEICEVIEDLDNELMTLQESERALMQLDEKYAAVIVKELA